MLFNNEKIIYTAARIIGIAVKPTTLACLSATGLINIAFDVGVYYFITASLFVIFNSESHREFYRKYFSNQRNKWFYISLSRYIQNTFIHLIFFIPIIYIFLCIYLDDGIKSFFLTLILLSEKIWDELQRFLIFSKSYIKWSILFISKTLLFLVSIFASFISEISFINIAGFVFSFYLLFTIKHSNRLSNGILFIKIFKTSILKSMTFYKKNYFSAIIMGQLGALFLANLLHVDKWFLSGDKNKEFFTSIVLLTQISSTFLILVDNLFFAFNRDRYVNPTITPKNIINWYKIFLLGFFFLLSINVFNYFFLQKLTQYYIEPGTSFLITLIPILVGTTRPLVEFNYWRRPRYVLTVVDGITITLLILAGYLSINNASHSVMYLSFSTILATRLISHFALANYSKISTHLTHKQ